MRFQVVLMGCPIEDISAHSASLSACPVYKKLPHPFSMLRIMYSLSRAQEETPAIQRSLQYTVRR